jgi:hypothetical protein
VTPLAATEAGVTEAAALGEPGATAPASDREDDREERDPEQRDEQEEESEAAMYPFLWGFRWREPVEPVNTTLVATPRRRICPADALGYCTGSTPRYSWYPARTSPVS